MAFSNTTFLFYTVLHQECTFFFSISNMMLDIQTKNRKSSHLVERRCLQLLPHWELCLDVLLVRLLSGDSVYELFKKSSRTIYSFLAAVEEERVWVIKGEQGILLNKAVPWLCMVAFYCCFFWSLLLINGRFARQNIKSEILFPQRLAWYCKSTEADSQHKEWNGHPFTVRVTNNQ